jgi:phosphopantetheine adenylyltransferase
LLTSDQHVLTSSTYVKQIYELGGGDPAIIERLVPANVAKLLSKKLMPRAKSRRQE